MKNHVHVCLLFFMVLKGAVAQDKPIGQEVRINLPDLISQQLKNADTPNFSDQPIVDFPMPDGKTLSFRVKESPIFQNQSKETKTYSGQSLNNTATIRFSITPTGGFSAIIQTENGYYIIEPIDKATGRYRLYNMNEVPRGNCANDGEAQAFGTLPLKNGRVLSIAPFPVGSQLRVYRMAAAATGEMVTTFGGQAQAKDKIVEILNAANLIYETEASIRFMAISQTTDSPYPILFTNGASDPFTVDSSFASAGNSQLGFNTLNSNASLLYNQYDVAHTFNSYTSSNSATWAQFYQPTYYVRGQAGGTPCNNSSKATGWTEFVNSAFLGSIVNIFAHEVAHQFSVGHTFNAVGGNNGFCTSGWSGSSAIEPGGGSTLMGYNSNCSSPVNYTLTNNFESYFHTRSLEQMFNAVNNTSTCYTATATGNTPPTANAGSDFYIPKGTPFTLTGTANDPNGGDVLSYAWEQYDIASANDKGAFGSNVAGTGGYTAVNSTASAPLFRSKIQNVPSRSFPSLNFILNFANNPPDNEGEDLPLMPRQMKFRFTVRDNRSGGGGVDSDETILTVAESGPFLITSQNTATTWFANGSNTATIVWSVNNTHLAPVLCSNVKISLSTDGGTTFPIVLAANTPNDGSQLITIPANATTNGRIKVEAIGNVFFDINNAPITITNSCNTVASTLTPASPITAQAGNSALFLNIMPNGSNAYRFVIVNTNGNTITAIQNTADLSNSAIFTTGTYELYGFSSPDINYNSYVGTSFASFQSLLPSTVCGQLSSNFVSVTIQACPALPPVSASASICTGDSITLIADGCAGTVNWTASPTWSPVPSGSTGRVAPTETTTYFATCTNGGCASATASAVITVNPIPNPPVSTAGATITRGATASLTANGCADGTTVNWFATATSTVVVGTGASFVTPTLATTTTYYASCFNGTCNSARLATTVIVTNPCLSPNSTFQPMASVTAVAGTSTLNLGLTALSDAISSVSGTIATTDPTTNLVYALNGNCQNGGNSTYYDRYSFMVTTGGNYTFNIAGAPFGILANLYSGSFNPGNLCAGWLKSTATGTGGPVTLNSSMTVTLTANTLYTLVVTGFSTVQPSYPASYTVNFAVPNGALIYETLPKTGSGYGYTYVVINNTTGLIVGFSPSGDLTNSAVYGVGQYTVRGLSYETSTVTNLNSYVNTPFSTFLNQFPLPNCGTLSSTSKSVTITPNCPGTLALTGTATSGTQQANQTITATQIVNSGVAVTYRAGNSITLLPATDSGFKADNGSTFKAEIGGCN